MGQSCLVPLSSAVCQGMTEAKKGYPDTHVLYVNRVRSEDFFALNMIAICRLQCAHHWGC